MIFRKKPIVVACLLALAAANSAYAQQSSSVDAKIEALQQQIEALKAEVNSKASISQVQQQAAASPGISMKPGKDLIFQLGDKSEVQIYGHVDVSYDEQTNGLGHNVGAVGHNGYVSDVSSNLSFFGVRGDRILNDDLKGVFQFETEVFYSATPGTSDQAADTTAQKTGLGSRNSYIGLQSATFGAIKLGKTDTPYKSSTARMDPFANSVADYNSIMGNTGGDTRAEFDVRLPHSVWYESPKWSGLSFNALLSPGQNRNPENDGYALGEPDCTGSNVADSSGCTDGSFGSAYSTSVMYEAGPLYVTAAYELHKDVNRIGDETVPGTVGVRNEAAYKIGAQYKFPTDTTVNAIYEKFKRDAITSSLDERSRNGTWLAVTQKVTQADDVNFGWAHAGNTPGEPLNGPSPVAGVSPAIGQATPDAANQYSIGFKHHFEGDRMTWYAVATELKNDQFGHYAIGVSGHGVTTRNQDGPGNSFTGNTLKAVSVGMTYDF